MMAMRIQVTSRESLIARRWLRVPIYPSPWALATGHWPLPSIRTKELTMQPPDHIGAILFPHNESHINRGRALGDDFYICRPDRVEDSRSEARRVPESDTNDRNNGTVLLLPYLAQLTEVTHQRAEAGAILDGERDAHLTTGKHVDDGLMPLEHLEERAQESVRAQHPRRADVDHGNSLLPGDRSNG